MIVKAYQTAFHREGEVKIRPVTIPDEEVLAKLNGRSLDSLFEVLQALALEVIENPAPIEAKLLDLAFYYGQNDFQPLSGFYSVSVGDVLELPGGRKFRVMGVGFKAEARVDWSRPAEKVRRHIQGLSPWPGAWTEHEGTRLKLLSAEPAHGKFIAEVILPNGDPINLTIYVHEVYVRGELVRVITGGRELELAIPCAPARAGLYEEIADILDGVEVACPRIFGPDIS